MNEPLTFTCFIRPQPQGSAKAFVIAGRARITSANSNLKPFRSEVTRCAIAEVASRGLEMPANAKHVAVRIELQFVFRKPDSTPKRRIWPVVKPDIDKLCRSTLDSLTGVAFHDDAQVISISATKHYGDVECVHVTVHTQK